MQGHGVGVVIDGGGFLYTDTVGTFPKVSRFLKYARYQKGHISRNDTISEEARFQKWHA